MKQYRSENRHGLLACIFQNFAQDVFRHLNRFGIMFDEHRDEFLDQLLFGSQILILIRVDKKN